MGFILGLDGSQFQGNPDFNQVKAAGYEFWLQRMSYAYPGSGNKFDPTANANYYGAKSAGMIVGGYHKVGWTDPISEADFFFAAMSPLAPGDILAYDIEPSSDVQVPGNWSEWEQAFVQRLHDRCGGLYPLRYMNISMDNAMPAQGIAANCAAWVAAPSYGWNDNVPVNVAVTIQQGATVHVPGVSANVVDTDAFFGNSNDVATLRQELLNLGYQPQAVSVPAPAPAPVTENNNANQPAPAGDSGSVPAGSVPAAPATPQQPAPVSQPVDVPTPPAIPLPHLVSNVPPIKTAPAPSAPVVMSPEPKRSGLFARLWEEIEDLFKKDK